MQHLVGALLAAVSLILGTAGLRADEGTSLELPTTVEGYGETLQAAKSVALSKAREVFAHYLAVNHPEIRVELTAKYLERHEIVVYLREQSVVHEDDNTPVFHVLYTVKKPTEQQLNELRDRSRVPWMVQRHRAAAFILAGLVLALLTCLGFLRLDEATHGYYSGRLLGGAVALVALAVFALWCWL